MGEALEGRSTFAGGVYQSPVDQGKGIVVLSMAFDK